MRKLFILICLSLPFISFSQLNTHPNMPKLAVSRDIKPGEVIDFSLHYIFEISGKCTINTHGKVAHFTGSVKKGKVGLNSNTYEGKVEIPEILSTDGESFKVYIEGGSEGRLVLTTQDLDKPITANCDVSLF